MDRAPHWMSGWPAHVHLKLPDHLITVDDAGWVTWPGTGLQGRDLKLSELSGGLLSESVGKGDSSRAERLKDVRNTDALIASSSMWTETNRRKYDRRHQRYPSDMNNDEWEALEPMLPVAKGVGRPRKPLLREITDGIRYVQKYGIPWDAMPKDLPPGSTGYDYWRVLADERHINQINHLLVMADREKAGREASPTLAIIDAPSIKCDAPDGERGYDAGKKVLGRQRHIAVDTDGRLLAVDVTTADVQDQDGGLPLAKRLVRLCPWIETIVVDGGYKAKFIEGVQNLLHRTVEVIKRTAFSKGFVLLPRRWRVEQTLGALTIGRRLKTDYDT